MLADVTLTYWTIPIALVAGLVAGMINTLAGNGSAITLPIMILFLGLDPKMANGTNRVGVLVGSLTGARTFFQSGQLDTRGITWLLIPAILGGIVGATAASMTAAQAMEWVILVAMFVMLGLVLLRPQRWLRDESDPDRQHGKISRILIFFLIGVHAGFIQAGVGILLLCGLVLDAGYSLVKANAIKVVIVFLLTIPALCIFAFSGQVHWMVGGIMAVGQSTGAWLAATFIVRYPRANVWIRRLLIVMIVLAIFKLGVDIISKYFL